MDDLRQQLSRFTVTNNTLDVGPMLRTQLDAGEAAVIVTASKSGLLPVLMDERMGRRVASMIYHLPVIGTGGLLVAAKQRGLIGAVGPLLQGMLAGGYHLGPALVAECLRRAGE